jgi:hypothetical protein
MGLKVLHWSVSQDTIKCLEYLNDCYRENQPGRKLVMGLIMGVYEKE